MYTHSEFNLVMDKTILKKDIAEPEVRMCMDGIISGKAGPVKIAAFLTALKAKGESADEIASFAKVLRENCILVDFSHPHLIDTCGTGGDNSGTFNISTCSAFVAAGAGAIVAKHGNRAVSGNSGSADVLENLGVKIGISPQTAKDQLEKIGISFLFAPNFHPAMKNIAPVRKELGFRTIFNMLGPLCNPVFPKRQVIGVFNRNILPEYAKALAALNVEHALVVSSDCDEISISAGTRAIEIKNAKTSELSISPEEFGIKRAEKSNLYVPDSTKSAEIIKAVLSGKQGPCRDVVLLNSGAALYIAGIAPNIAGGITFAEKSIDSGKALEKLEELKNFE